MIHESALGDERLRELVVETRSSPHPNAPAILARLRQIRGERTPLALPAPPIPRPDDWRFEAAADGRLRLSDDPLGNDDADQAAMQDDLRRRAEALARTLAGSNEFAPLADDARGYAGLLARPASEIGAKTVWALSCIFRAALAADEAAETEGRASDRLPPLARAALTNVVTIGGAWLLDHPGVAEVEAKARSWRAPPGEEREAAAALPVPTAIAAQTDVVEAETALALSALARLGQRSKAALDAMRGLVVFLLRAPVKFVRWSGNRLIWIGGALDGAAKLTAATYIAAQLLVTHEAAIRIWLTAHAPDTLRWFDALYRLFRSIGP